MLAGPTSNPIHMCDRGINFENNHMLTFIHLEHEHIATPTLQVLLKHEENIIENIPSM